MDDLRHQSEAEDKWSKWLLETRFGGDEVVLRSTLDFLFPIRDRVLDGIKLDTPNRILEVGCGDGLIGIGALERYPQSQVIFSDISADLLNHLRSMVQDLGLENRCEFSKISAEDLAGIEDSSIDAVTLRSVLIYIEDKLRTVSEIYRVLNRGGWLSLFEPINRFMFPEPDDVFFGYDVSQMKNVASKLKRIYCPDDGWQTDPMMDFTGEDLIELARKVGFDEAHLVFEAHIEKQKQPMDWHTFEKISPNPNVPAFGDAIRSELYPSDAEAFIEYLSPKVKEGQGIETFAGAYLTAKK